MHHRFSDQITFLIRMLIFLDFRAQKLSLNFFYVNPFQHPQVLHFGVLNYEKQHKEVSGRSVVVSAFYAGFCLCSKLVIITSLIEQTVLPSSFFYCAKLSNKCINIEKGFKHGIK